MAEFNNSSQILQQAARTIAKAIENLEKKVKPTGADITSSAIDGQGTVDEALAFLAASQLTIKELSSPRNNSVNYTVAKNTKCVIIAIGHAQHSGIWIVNATSSGSMSVYTVSAGTNLAMTSSADYSVTFTNSGNTATPVVRALVFMGEIEDTQE